MSSNERNIESQLTTVSRTDWKPPYTNSKIRLERVGNMVFAKCEIYTGWAAGLFHG